MSEDWRRKWIHNLVVAIRKDFSSVAAVSHAARYGQVGTSMAWPCSSIQVQAVRGRGAGEKGRRGDGAFQEEK